MEDLSKDPKTAGLPMGMTERITNLVTNHDQVINRSHESAFSVVMFMFDNDRRKTLSARRQPYSGQGGVLPAARFLSPNGWVYADQAKACGEE
jgi:hypothetical protein